MTKKLCLIAIYLVCSLAFSALGVNEDVNSARLDRPGEDEAVETAAEKTIEKIAEKAVEKATEKAAKDTVEQNELKNKRPGESMGPTDVRFLVFVVDIDNVDGAAQSFTANVFVYLSWKDARLAHEGGARVAPITDIWNPRLLLVNRGGIVQKSLPEVAEVASDGTVIYRQRYTGPLSQPLKLSEFPFDEHQFTIQFAATGYTPEEVQFIPGSDEEGLPSTGGVLYSELSLPDWNITGYQAQANPYEPMKGVETGAFAFEFTAKRYALYYVWQVIVPLVFIVMMSWGAFYIDPTNTGAQIGVATSSMLTLIAYRFMLGSLIPRLPYMTRLDYFTLGSTVLVFLTLMEVVLTTNMALRKKEKGARRIDKVCRFIFPAVFVCVMVFSFWI